MGDYTRQTEIKIMEEKSFFFSLVSEIEWESKTQRWRLILSLFLSFGFFSIAHIVRTK